MKTACADDEPIKRTNRERIEELEGRHLSLLAQLIELKARVTALEKDEHRAKTEDAPLAPRWRADGAQVWLDQDEVIAATIEACIFQLALFGYNDEAIRKQLSVVPAKLKERK